jgi:hypothetical protein
MSFGFSKRRARANRRISEAIEKVRREREDAIIFFASAGNSWDERENFPASHRDVISIYAADATRRPSELNPSRIDERSKQLYSCGDDIPLYILKDIQDRFPNAELQAGTSIATAVAAGVAATTLAYISALPILLGNKGFEEACALIYTKRGMEHMLHKMRSIMSYGQHFINPISFWRERPRAMDVWVTISVIAENMYENE